MTEATLPATRTQQSGHLAQLPPGLTKELSDAESRLVPAGAKTGSMHLLECLTLVAPVGMTEIERSQWLMVAKKTLTGMPGDLLEAGCKAARERADHPSKVVKIIMDEVKDVWDQRKRRLAQALQQAANAGVPRLEQMDHPAVPHETTQAILKEVFGNMRVATGVDGDMPQPSSTAAEVRARIEESGQ